MGVFTADHLIEPAGEFLRIVQQGYALAEQAADVLVTFGIAPTGPATSFGYLELGEDVPAGPAACGSSTRNRRKTWPTPISCAGPERYLWNSGMFVWRAATLLDRIRRYEPEVLAGLEQIVRAWDTPQGPGRLAEIFPRLKKISIDFAVMEPASRDAGCRVAAVAMPLRGWTSAPGRPTPRPAPATPATTPWPPRNAFWPTPPAAWSSRPTQSISWP